MIEDPIERNTLAHMIVWVHLAQPSGFWVQCLFSVLWHRMSEHAFIVLLVDLWEVFLEYANDQPPKLAHKVS